MTLATCRCSRAFLVLFFCYEVACSFFMGTLPIREDSCHRPGFVGNGARTCLHDRRHPGCVSEALTHDPGQVNHLSDQFRVTGLTGFPLTPSGWSHSARHLYTHDHRPQFNLAPPPPPPPPDTWKLLFAS